ncbi:hypothetical protein [Geminicoccus flavidas]|uniref:hypothetical protein n=1 Tax=Geminicoccus flavidas TaxID=2506407 RepID=UPI0013580593|nr:hypothetical protein [Geminicoccus flavidas]
MGHDASGGLQAHRVLRTAEEVTDAQVLLQPAGEQFDPAAGAAGAGSIPARAAVKRRPRAVLKPGRIKVASSSRNSSLAMRALHGEGLAKRAGTSASTGADERPALASAKVERRTGMILRHPGASA